MRWREGLRLDKALLAPGLNTQGVVDRALRIRRTVFGSMHCIRPPFSKN